MVLVIGRVEGRYETQEVPFGEVYSWRSGRVVLECDCGEVLNLTGSTSVCGCGIDHAATVREELAAVWLGTMLFTPGATSGTAKTPGYPIKELRLGGLRCLSDRVLPVPVFLPCGCVRTADPSNSPGKNETEACVKCRENLC